MMWPSLPTLILIGLAARPQLANTTSTTRVHSQPIQTAVTDLAADVSHWGGALGAHIIDLQKGEVVAAFGEHRPLNPASNAKLWTAAAALRVLGVQHRFITGLYGNIDDHAVDELVLRGDGDPSLRTPDLWALAADLRAAGVHQVRAITVDQSFFDDHYVPPAFEQQPDEWAPFRAPVAPVSLNENTVMFSVHATQEGKDAILDVDPPGFVEIQGNVTTARKDDPENVHLGLDARDAKLIARLSGSVPQGGRIVRLAKRVDDPRLLAGHALRAILKQVGIDVSGPLRLGTGGKKRLLVVHRSASVGEMLSALGKESDNFYAEMLFKAIGAKAKGRPASANTAADVLGTILADLGAFEVGVVVKNGSGLFDADRMTAATTTTLLRAMQRDTFAGPEYMAQLSIGGVDGTLRHRFRCWADKRTIRAKTGTLDGVAALSGYVVGPEGQRSLAFSLLVNGIAGKLNAAREGMDKVVDTMAREVWNPPGSSVLP